MIFEFCAFCCLLLRRFALQRQYSEKCSSCQPNLEPRDLLSCHRDFINYIRNETNKSPPNIARQKDISWEDKEYQEKNILQDLGTRSQSLILERRASVGPCFRAGMPFCGPSGITICLPRKSPKNVDFSFTSIPSGINITVSKKNIAEKLKSPVNELGKEGKTNEISPENYPKEGVPIVKFFGVLRGKIDNVRGKIKNVFNM